jgi:hypothetical protein
VGPKKKERWTMLSSGMIVPLVSATSSYSRCVQVTRGGSLALRMCLCHNGGMDGAKAPCAISLMAVMNWTTPAASLIVWLRRKAKMNPPHLRRVTYQSTQQKDSRCLHSTSSEVRCMNFRMFQRFFYPFGTVIS